jgi:hypothetical protein
LCEVPFEAQSLTQGFRGFDGGREDIDLARG